MTTNSYREFTEDDLLQNNLIRIMPKEGNSFQIVLTPAVKKEPPPKNSAKRKAPKEAKARPVKKARYERRTPLRSAKRENGLLRISDFACQTSIYTIQSKFIQEVGVANQPLVQTLSSAYAYNENLSIIRTAFRKKNVKSYLKKCLARMPFNQNQQFSGSVYRPGQAFIKYQNSVNKGRVNADGRKIPGKAADQISGVENMGGFVCEGCKRADTKKYAKGLCQTCYKRKKKFGEGIEEQRTTITPEVASRINEKPEPLPIPNKEWTGTCPDCKR